MGLNKTHISLCLISAFLFFAGWPTFGNPVFLFLIFVPIFFLQKKINEDNGPTTIIYSKPKNFTSFCSKANLDFGEFIIFLLSPNLVVFHA